jgi:hypothetical protein
MPVWFIGVPGPNAVKLLAEWHVSQAPVVGRWFVGFVFIVTPTNVLPVS